MERWRCSVCGYVYDESAGDPSGGVRAGTPFSALPPGWGCPICGAGKEAFRKVPPDTDPHADSATTVSDVLVAELVAWGVDLVFGIPGTSSLGIVDAIRRNRSIRYIVVRHEANAALAASAYNKVSGRVAACLTIAGPGATNLATGLYDAKEDHASVLSLNGQVESQYTGSGGIQEIDQDAFFRPITVYNNTIYEKNKAVLVLTRALRHAIVGRGVAQVSVPNDIQKQPLEAHFCTREACIVPAEILPPDDRLRAAAAAIDGAASPVILAGWGAYPDGQAVASMAEKIKAPILTTFRAKGILPDDHPLLIGVLGNVGSPQARTLADGADLIITLGVGFSQFTRVPAEKKLVQVEIDPLRLGRNPGSIGIWGSCSAVIRGLLPLVREREDRGVRERIGAMKRAWNEQRDREADGNAVPLRPPFIMKILSEVIPPDAVISVDVGENQWWFGRNFRTKGQRFAMSGYLATMGCGLPGAIAAKLAYPDRKVFCISGDGGFAMAMGEFVTAVRYSLPMVVVILNNHQLGMIRVEQQMEDYPNYATDLINPDFARYAEACGGSGIRVGAPADLRPALLSAIAQDRPVIIDIETDPERF